MAAVLTLVVRRGADLAVEVTGLDAATLAVLLPALVRARET